MLRLRARQQQVHGGSQRADDCRFHFPGHRNPQICEARGRNRSVLLGLPRKKGGASLFSAGKRLHCLRMDGWRFYGNFSRWLTLARLFSSCYQPLFRSKVICTYHPSCGAAPNSRATAVKRAPQILILSRDTKGFIFYYYFFLPLAPGTFGLCVSLCHQHQSSL